MEFGLGSSLLVRLQAGRCPEIDNVVTHCPYCRTNQTSSDLACTVIDNGDRGTPLDAGTQWNQAEILQ